MRSDDITTIGWLFNRFFHLLGDLDPTAAQLIVESCYREGDTHEWPSSTQPEDRYNVLGYQDRETSEANRVSTPIFQRAIRLVLFYDDFSKGFAGREHRGFSLNTIHDMYIAKAIIESAWDRQRARLGHSSRARFRLRQAAALNPQGTGRVVPVPLAPRLHTADHSLEDSLTEPLEPEQFSGTHRRSRRIRFFDFQNDPANTPQDSIPEYPRQVPMDIDESSDSEKEDDGWDSVFHWTALLNRLELWRLKRHHSSGLPDVIEYTNFMNDPTAPLSRFTTDV
jgi:hypothetical protein